MLYGYERLFPVVTQIDLPKMKEMLLDDSEECEITKLPRLLHKLESVTKALHESWVTLSDAHVLFENVVENIWAQDRD